jgi:hypothetical protein
MDEKSRASVDQIFLDIESLLNIESEPVTEVGSITLSVSLKYKEKFDELQERTDKRFGKKLKDLVYLAINRAYEKSS